MGNVSIDPAPPSLPGLDWRPVNQNNLDAIVELAKSCYKVDGGLSFLFEPDLIKSRYFPDKPVTGMVAFMPDRRLAACTTVYRDGNPGEKRAKIIGQVHPEVRNKGIGTYLIRWSQVQAQKLLAGVVAEPGLMQVATESLNDPCVMQVATESLTEPAHHLYLAHGFQNVFDELVMERDLHLPLPDRPLPIDVTITHWQSGLADQFFQAYHAAFQERPGFPGYSADEWISRVIEDDQIPEWTLLARVDGVPVGFVLGNIILTSDPPGGYIAQIGVVPSQRRRGLASALLVETMRRMQVAGSVETLLTVHINNPGAILAYSQLGFSTIGRRARFERSLEQ